ncbi:DMT family transporter [Methanobacterium subterraneum]|uniref:DMT family transporter n=1 Tax=Methanobacterium subterraneum TaxID=59277 RepID=A0A7K4DL73_9EURY|nr:DMT family transporter [Methanobacterium subterraneum]MBW4258120.1 DMT family transporter [Methanobacterium sp. YSL]NMO09140.1 DMT family transporter [Methanobacterium subterraneum]PKL72849.1 MAG: EamA family transporter [Methanobacteriales archaeon HGW-Methanobacteriales-2]
MNRFWGYLSAVMVALLFGIWFSLDKILLGYLHPLALAALIYLLASAFLFLIRVSPLHHSLLEIVHRESKVQIHISRRNYLTLFLTAIFGTVIAPVLYLTGLNQITAVNAALLTNVEILFIILLGIFFLKEKVKAKDIVGFIFLLIGAIFLSTNNLQDLTFDQSLVGSLLVVSACFFWSMDTTLTKFLSNKRDIFLLTSLKCGIGGLILFLISIFLGLNFTLPLNMVPVLLFIGLGCMSFSIVLTYIAIREIGSTRTGSIFSTSSLFGAVVAFIILGESLEATQLFFGILMFLGILILYKNGNKIN